MHPDKCPKCKVPWRKEETIYEYFLREYNNEEEARKSAEMYGCTPEHPMHFGVNVVGIEDSEIYDGISYWKCQKCNTYFSRWTMKEIELQDR